MIKTNMGVTIFVPEHMKKMYSPIILCKKGKADYVSTEHIVLVA